MLSKFKSRVKSNGGKNNSSNKSELLIVSLGLIFTCIIAVLLLEFYFNSINHSWFTQENFALFGDFIGGTLNPILGFATVGLLIWSIRLQMKELRLTREELTATKDEAEKSRLALEGQLSHLKEEFYVNELNRVREVYVNKYVELIMKPLVNQREIFSVISKTLSHVDPVCCFHLIEKKYKGRSLSSANIAANKKYIKEKVGIGSHEGKQWLELVQTLKYVSLLTIEYHQLSKSSNLSGIYIYDLSLKVEELKQLVADSALIQCDDALKSICESEEVMKSLEEAISDLLTN